MSRMMSQRWTRHHLVGLGSEWSRCRRKKCANKRLNSRHPSRGLGVCLFDSHRRAKRAALRFTQTCCHENAAPPMGADGFGAGERC